MQKTSIGRIVYKSVHNFRYSTQSGSISQKTSLECMYICALNIDNAAESS